MGEFFISGIQQVGVGTVDMRKSREWFAQNFGINVKILEDNTVAGRMLPYTGGVPQKRSASICVNLQGGGGLEIWQYSDRQPVPPAFLPVPGDLGIFAAKIKCRDIGAFLETCHRRQISCSVPYVLPDGTACAYVRDLYGNCFQLVEDKSLYIERGSLTGGVAGALVGVSDMDRSLAFYSEVLGYDTVLSDSVGEFGDLTWLSVSDPASSPDSVSDKGLRRAARPVLSPETWKCRRVILGKSSPSKGAFSGLFGTSTMELIQSLDRTPRKIYEGRFWGDPGFIQICFDVTGMDALGGFCASKGHPFTVDSCPKGETFDMGEASGRFTYIEDPDGTLIEFVETERIPIVKALGWYLDLRKRDRSATLPKFLFRILGLVSTEKTNTHAHRHF